MEKHGHYCLRFRASRINPGSGDANGKTMRNNIKADIM